MSKTISRQKGPSQTLFSLPGGASAKGPAPFRQQTGSLKFRELASTQAHVLPSLVAMPFGQVEKSRGVGSLEGFMSWQSPKNVASKPFSFEETREENEQRLQNLLDQMPLEKIFHSSQSLSASGALNRPIVDLSAMKFQKNEVEFEKQTETALKNISREDVSAQLLLQAAADKKLSFLDAYTLYAAQRSLGLSETQLNPSEMPSLAKETLGASQENFWKVLAGISQVGTRIVAQTAPSIGGSLGGMAGSLYGLGVVYATSILNGIFQAYVKKRQKQAESLMQITRKKTNLDAAQTSVSTETAFLGRLNSYERQDEERSLVLKYLEKSADRSFIPSCLEIFK